MSTSVDKVLTEGHFLFLDCQTTGANPKHGRLLEIAWMIQSPTSNEPEMHHYLLSQEDGQIPPRIRQLTGITESDLSDAVTPDIVREALLSALSLSVEACVIHFARFELPFVAALLGTEDATSVMPVPIICTHELARRLHPGLPSRGIRALAGYYGKDLHALKRAPSHVHATQLIWQAIVNELIGRDIHSLSQVQTFLGQPPPPKPSKRIYALTSEKRLSLPARPGIYRMVSRSGKVLYVGKATSLKDRVNSYFRGIRNKPGRQLEMLTQVVDLECTTTETITESALLETDLIKTYDPPYNIALKSGNREVCFYTRELDRVLDQPKTLADLGPFTTSQNLHDLILLTLYIHSDQQIELLPSFLIDVTIQDIGEAIEDLVSGAGLALSQVTPRTLLALGFKLWRQRLAEERDQLTEDTEDFTLDETSEGNDLGPDSSQEESVEEELLESKTAAEGLTLSGKEQAMAAVQSLLRRSARRLHRSYKLRSIANGLVAWPMLDDAKACDGNNWRILVLRNGSVVEKKTSPSRPTDNLLDQALRQGGQLPGHWDIATYDRLRVLLTEMDRIRKTGRQVIQLYFFP